MSILSKLNSRCRIDVSGSGSDEREIGELTVFSEIAPPDDFLEVIREQSEIEISLDGRKYLRIWGAKGCIEMNTAYRIQEYIPSSLAIGDDEGGNALIYATGRQGFGLYIVAFNDLEAEEMQFVAGSLSDLFVHGDGLEIVISC